MKSELIDDDDFIGSDSEDDDLGGGEVERDSSDNVKAKNSEEHAKMARRRIEILREERALRRALDEIFDEDD